MIIFIFNVFGFYLFFEISTIQIKEEVSDNIEKNSSFSNIEIIAFPLNPITEQYQYDKEVWFNNKLYDIVKKELKSDTIFLSVLSDQKEEHLITQLNTHLEHGLDNVFHAIDSKHPLKGIYKYSSQKFLANAGNSYRRFSKSISICFFTSNYDSIYFHFILTPPPEKLIS